MGQLVFYEASLKFYEGKEKSITINLKLVYKSYMKKPETGWSNHEQVEVLTNCRMKDRTLV